MDNGQYALHASTTFCQKSRRRSKKPSQTRSRRYRAAQREVTRSWETRQLIERFTIKCEERDFEQEPGGYIVVAKQWMDGADLVPSGFPTPILLEYAFVDFRTGDDIKAKKDIRPNILAWLKENYKKMEDPVFSPTDVREAKRHLYVNIPVDISIYTFMVRVRLEFTIHSNRYLSLLNPSPPKRLWSVAKIASCHYHPEETSHA